MPEKLVHAAQGAPLEGEAAERLGNEIRERGEWGDATSARFQEYVAREHVDGRMPMIELHRTHGLPLSAVRRWVQTYAAEGRPGLERNAEAANARARKRAAALRAKAPQAAEVAALQAAIASHHRPAMREAYATIERRKLDALIPAVVEALWWAANQEDQSLQGELDVLAALGATAALEAIFASKDARIGAYAGWRDSLLARAARNAAR